MLLKILGATINNEESKLSVVLSDDTNTKINLTGQTIEPTWFKLEKFSDFGFEDNIVILDAEVDMNEGINGKITITFDSGSDFTPQVSVGDILILSPGETVPSNPPFSKIMNSASIYTGLGNTPLKTINQYIRIPSPKSTKDIAYNLSLDFLEKNGNDITSTKVINLASPVVVNGLSIESIKFEIINYKASGYSANDAVQFKVTFYSEINALGDPIEFEGSADDILSVSFTPIL